MSDANQHGPSGFTRVGALLSEAQYRAILAGTNPSSFDFPTPASLVWVCDTCGVLVYNHILHARLCHTLIKPEFRDPVEDGRKP